jgi:hypothetical protein
VFYNAKKHPSDILCSCPVVFVCVCVRVRVRVCVFVCGEQAVLNHRHLVPDVSRSYPQVNPVFPPYPFCSDFTLDACAHVLQLKDLSVAGSEPLK